MDLKLKDLAEILQVSQKTIYRWINDNRIPYYRINHQYRFKTDEINRWAVNNKMEIPQSKSIEPLNFSDCIKNGGIFYNISGNDIFQALEEALAIINIPFGFERNRINTLILDRERKTPTLLDNGIMVPHPPTPLIKSYSRESISLCFLNQSIQYSSNNKTLVNLFFIILMSSKERFMRTLSTITALSEKREFIDFISKTPLRKDVLSYFKKM